VAGALTGACFGVLAGERYVSQRGAERDRGPGDPLTFARRDP
jgi:hypothetical protein